MIYYSAGSSGSVSVSDGSMDNYLLTDLQNGDNYTISVAGRSQHLPSDTMIEEVFLGEIPNRLLHVHGYCQHFCLLPLQFQVSLVSVWSPQHPPPSHSAGVFPVAQ